MPSRANDHIAVTIIDNDCPVAIDHNVRPIDDYIVPTGVDDVGARHIDRAGSPVDIGVGTLQNGRLDRIGPSDLKLRETTVRDVRWRRATAP